MKEFDIIFIYKLKILNKEFMLSEMNVKDGSKFL